MKQAQALVVDHQTVKENFRLLTLEVPEIAAIAKPGQFVHVRCGGTMDPLLRRPLSLHKIEADQGRLMLLYQIVGRGTALLAEKKPGEQVDIMGPLGHGFTIPERVRRAVVVGGGIGTAPLLPLVQTLAAAQIQTTVILGAKNADLLVGADPIAQMAAKRAAETGKETAVETAAKTEIKTGRKAVKETRTETEAELITVTEDGSAGERGLVTDALRRILAAKNTDYLYACGPKPMLKAVAVAATEFGVPGEVSLEERMGCGVGACLACVCKTKKAGAAADNAGAAEFTGNPGFTYRRVCDHGPVFSLAEVVFDD